MYWTALTVLTLSALGPPPCAAAHVPPHVNSLSSNHAHPQKSWRTIPDSIVGWLWKQSGIAKVSVSASKNILSSSRDVDDSLVARYGDDVVLRFKIRNEEEARTLARAAKILFLDVWEFNDDWADVRIAKDSIRPLLRLLPQSLQSAHEPLMQDLDLVQAILYSLPSMPRSQPQKDDQSSPLITTSQRTATGHSFFQDYQPLSVMNPWMSLLSSMFTTHVRRISVGTSYEGREISALRVGVHPTNNDKLFAPRKMIIIAGGAHAREWISSSTVNYLAWSLISAFGKDREITRFIHEFDFVFVPTLNPDGYAYSWETDRLWRKNRQPTSFRFCRGIDLDRSYSYKWDGDAVKTNPCAESFSGDAPFEAVETRHFAEWAKNETVNNNVEIVGFLDLHSYSQQILYPYSYSCDEEPPFVEDLEELAIGLAKAIRVGKKGHEYKVTSACEGNVVLAQDKRKRVLSRIEASGGSALDYFYHELKVKYSYQFKLRDTGGYGFLLPRDNIIPTGEEILDALMYFGRFILGEIGAQENTIPNQSKQAKDNENAVGAIEDDWVLVNKTPAGGIDNDVSVTISDDKATQDMAEIMEL